MKLSLLVMVDCVEKGLSCVGTDFLRAADALGVLGRGGPPLLSESIQWPSQKLQEGIASRSRPSARFCANFAEAAFSTFSTWGNSGIEPDKDLGNQLSRDRGASLMWPQQRWRGAMECYVGLDVSLKHVDLRSEREGIGCPRGRRRFCS